LALFSCASAAFDDLAIGSWNWFCATRVDLRLRSFNLREIIF
jgi:hypothetical protein